MNISELSVVEVVVYVADPHCPKDHNPDEVAKIELFSSIIIEVLTSCYTISPHNFFSWKILSPYKCHDI